MAAAAPDDDLQIGVKPFGVVGLLRCVIATIYGLMCLPYVPVWFVLGALMMPFPGLPHAFVHWLIGIFLEVWCVCFGIHIEVEGAEHVDPKQTYVIAANHRSWLDAVSLIVAFKVHQGNLKGRKIYFIIKRSLLFIPGFGLYMLWARYIHVVRGKASKAEGGRGDNSARIEAAVTHLKMGKTVLIFPEGTRTKTHRFQKFKRGAAEMSIRSGMPILPVVISGSGYLYPKGKTYIRPGKVRIEIRPPIFPEGHTRESLTQATYDTIADRYRLTVDGPPLEENPDLLKRCAPEHTRFRGEGSGAQAAPRPTTGSA